MSEETLSGGAGAGGARAGAGAPGGRRPRYEEPRSVPEDGEPVVDVDLASRQGHFMGEGHNRLLLYTRGRPWVRAVGTSDPMPRHVNQAYRVAGHQLAKQIA